MNNKDELIQDRRSFFLKATAVGGLAAGGVLAASKAAAAEGEIINLPEATIIPSTAYFQYQDSAGGVGSTKKVTFEQIRRLSNSISVLMFDKDAGTGDAAKDFAAINAGLAALKKGQSLYLPSDRKYKINSQLTEPPYSHWGLVSDVGAYAEIDITSLPSSQYLIAATRRGWGIHNLFIYGNGGVSGSNHNYTANGLKMSDAAFTMSHLRFFGLKKALHFVYAHDAQQIDSIECYSNHTDIHFSDQNSSSLRFRNVSMVMSEIAILQEYDLTNVAFDGCTFAPAPYDPYINPVDFNHKVTGCSIRSSRFEMIGTNAPGSSWNALYLKGFAAAHPVANFSITDCHFTGKLKNCVYGDAYVKGLKFHDNILNGPPSESDLYLRGSVIESSIKRNNAINAANGTDRNISIVMQSGSALSEAIVDRSYPKNLNGYGSPEGVVDAPLNSMYVRADGGAGTWLYRKTTATGQKTGWVAAA